MRYMSSKKMVKPHHIATFLWMSLLFASSSHAQASTITRTPPNLSAQNTTALPSTQEIKTNSKEWIKEAPQGIRKQSSKLYRKKLKSADYFALLNE